MPVTAAAGPTGGLNVLSGKAIYEQSCITCHGDDGAGGMPGVPDMTEKGGSLDKPGVVLVRNIMDGFQSPGSIMAMPPKGGNPELVEEQVWSVISYMRQAFGKQEKRE